MSETTLRQIAHIRCDFPTKFGIPRQSGLVPELRARIVFEPEFRDPAALRGLDGYNYLWLLWEFSESVREGWSPTVRPPRLGGNRRMGVFATRSPFRPNPLGLSSVKLLGLQKTAHEGTVLIVSGADLMDRTPIYDIKPYLPHIDSHPDALAGFTQETRDYALTVVFPPELLGKLSPEAGAALTGILQQDPRPSYQEDPGRIYGFPFAGWEVRFTVDGPTLTVRELLPR